MPNEFVIAYDFDDTLSASNLAEGVIQRLQCSMTDFLQGMRDMVASQQCDPLLAYMGQIITLASHKHVPVTHEFLKACGAAMRPFKGIEAGPGGWFATIARTVKQRDLTVKHYVISCNMKEIISGTPIAPCFSDIFGSSYVYDERGNACWPAVAVTAAEKCACVTAICSNLRSEHTLDEQKNAAILRTPYSRVIYIGDGATDIPAMRFVSSHGGHAIAVYDPEKKEARAKAEGLHAAGHAGASFPADYSQGSPLFRHVQAILQDAS